MGLPHGVGRRRIVPWLRSSSARHGLLLLRRNLIVGCEHRAAAIGELRRVLPQAGDDTVHIRDLAAAQTPDIRRASHLLFPRAAIFSCISRANARHCHRSKARDQARSVQFAYPRPPCLTNSSSTNEAREGSWPTTTRDSHRRSGTGACFTLPPAGADERSFIGQSCALLRFMRGVILLFSAWFRQTQSRGPSNRAKGQLLDLWD